MTGFVLAVVLGISPASPVRLSAPVLISAAGQSSPAGVAVLADGAAVPSPGGAAVPPVTGFYPCSNHLYRSDPLSGHWLNLAPAAWLVQHGIPLETGSQGDALYLPANDPVRRAPTPSGASGSSDPPPYGAACRDLGHAGPILFFECHPERTFNGRLSPHDEILFVDLRPLPGDPPALSFFDPRTIWYELFLPREIGAHYHAVGDWDWVVTSASGGVLSRRTGEALLQRGRSAYTTETSYQAQLPVREFTGDLGLRDADHFVFTWDGPRLRWRARYLADHRVRAFSAACASFVP